VPESVREVSEGLQYRDFITVGLLAERLKVQEPDGGVLKDTWIYVQEPDVLLGRLQIFNNWSPYLVEDSSKVWIGLEYFCYEGDPLWSMGDEELKRFAIAEVAKIGILKAEDVSDGHVVRVPKTYPAYFGTYKRFDELREFTDRFENLFLVGRNGMHKYNNQDHSIRNRSITKRGSSDESSDWAFRFIRCSAGGEPAEAVCARSSGEGGEERRGGGGGAGLHQLFERCAGGRAGAGEAIRGAALEYAAGSSG
jgi:hypothetical protein